MVAPLLLAEGWGGGSRRITPRKPSVFEAESIYIRRITPVSTRPYAQRPPPAEGVKLRVRFLRLVQTRRSRTLPDIPLDCVRR